MYEEEVRGTYVLALDDLVADLHSVSTYALPGAARDAFLDACKAEANGLYDLFASADDFEVDRSTERWGHADPYRYWLAWSGCELTVSVSRGNRMLARISEDTEQAGDVAARLAVESSMDIWMRGWDPRWPPDRVRIPLGCPDLDSVYGLSMRGTEPRMSHPYLTVKRS